MKIQSSDCLQLQGNITNRLVGIMDTCFLMTKFAYHCMIRGQEKVGTHWNMTEKLIDPAESHNEFFPLKF